MTNRFGFLAAGLGEFREILLPPTPGGGRLQASVEQIRDRDGHTHVLCCLKQHLVGGQF
jgi:hypothetical protein